MVSQRHTLECAIHLSMVGNKENLKSRSDQVHTLQCLKAETGHERRDRRKIGQLELNVCSVRRRPLGPTSREDVLTHTKERRTQQEFPSWDLRQSARRPERGTVQSATVQSPSYHVSTCWTHLVEVGVREGDHVRRRHSDSCEREQQRNERRETHRERGEGGCGQVRAER
jgi:hypothetical protein